MSMFSARRRTGRVLLGLLAAGLACAMLSVPVAAQPDTLEIPNEEFEAFESDAEGYKPNPLLEPRHPLDTFFNFGDIDMTGTLPDAVMEHVLGASPYAFADAVWEMEVTGSWTQSLSGRGTIQVNDFTEGMGATATADPERFTGERGLRTYTARMPVRDDQVFTLSAGFPPTDGDRYGWGSELDGAKAAFWLYACHIFERDRTGCNEDGRDSYYYTETPTLENLHIFGSRGSYSMRFTVRVEEYHYESGPGVVGGIRRTFTGRVGVIRGWICEADAWEADPETCAQDEPLRVVENAPEHGRENVNFEGPAVEWEFSAPVDRDSLEEGFTLTTRDTNGRDIEVAGEIVRQSGNRFAFLPDIDLESGVQYEARIEGGEEGVHAREGDAYLPADHWWRFSTILDLEFQNNSDEEPLEVHIFQTVRDAPLVAEKPSVIRIYPYWEAHDHIHPDWQPTSFPITLDLNVVSEAERRVELQFGETASTDEIRMYRPDQFNDEHKRLAQHTLNVYGWSPARRSGSAPVVEASLAARAPYPAPLDPAELIAERDYEIWQTDPGPLVFRYAFLEVGAWEEGVPEADMNAAMDVVRQAEEFTVQIMPFREVYGIDSMREADRNYANYYRDNVAAIVEGVASLTDDGREVVNFNALKNTILRMREDMEGLVGPREIMVVFYPLDFLPFGQNVDNIMGDNPRRGVGMGITRDMPPSALAMGLVHEFGHHFGLSHRPAVALPPGGFVDFGIEGFRIAPDGMSGRNKSATEGNAEHPTILVPLMWPKTLPAGQVFVSESDYQTFMNAIESR